VDTGSNTGQRHVHELTTPQVEHGARVRCIWVTRVRRAFTTTRGRLTCLWLAIFAAALMVANVGIYLTVTFKANSEVEAELRSQADSVGAGVQVVDGRPAYVRGDLPHETSSGLLVDLALVGAEGTIQQTRDQPLSDAILRSLATPALRSGQPILVDFYDQRHVHRRAYVAPVGISDQPVAILASTPLTDVESSVALTTALVALLSLAVLAGSTALVHWLIGRVLSPVSRIANLAESLSERDLHRRVDVHAPDDEVGELVRTFNRMLARLDASFAALRSFTADASHELRSPLALMATELEYALARRRSTEELKRVLRLLQVEVHHMTEMVEKLLMLARIDAGQLRPAREQVDVADFVHETAARWLVTAAEKEVRVEVEVPDSGAMLVDPSLTRRILDNLIDNGIRHSPTGARLRVRAARDGGGWLLEVSDQGPGIPAGQNGRLFERFARSDSARARGEGGGAGLGLPLSLAFARVQGGELCMVERPGWGAVFQARIPDAGADGEPGTGP
jgi:two-component system, OmpR family, sensor kinase